MNNFDNETNNSAQEQYKRNILENDRGTMKAVVIITIITLIVMLIACCGCSSIIMPWIFSKLGE